MMNTQEVQTAKLDRFLVSGIAWTALIRWLAQLISWAATFYAARLLKPSHYGIVAMATVPIGLARMAEDFGLDAVLVQDRSIDADRQSRLAGFALMLGFACCVIFVSLAYPIASFFDEPSVALAICALSALFIFDALQIVPRAMMQRRLEFRRLALVWLVQVLFTSATLVLAARGGLGHWALILNSLCGGMMATVLLIWWHPYRIRWPGRLAAIAGPILQGWRVLSTRMAWYAYTTADQTAIGKILGKDALGTYSFATTFANLPMQELTSIVSRVVPGVFSEVQNERSALRRYFIVLTEFIAILAFPIAAGIALVADLAVALALGPGWDGVVTPLRILLIYTAFFAAQVLVAHVLMWTGQFRALMWCAILTGVTMPLGFIVGTRYGIVGVAWVWAILFPLTNIPPLVIGFRTLGTNVWQFVRLLTAPLVGCAGMTIIVLLVRSRWPASMLPIQELVITAACGAVTYAAILWFGFRATVIQVWQTIRAVRA